MSQILVGHVLTKLNLKLWNHDALYTKMCNHDALYTKMREDIEIHTVCPQI